MSISGRQLSILLAEAEFSTWGVAHIAGLHPLAESHPTAVSLGLAYRIPFEEYSEPEYLALTVRVREEFDAKLSKVCQVLSESGVRYLVPGVPPNDPANGVPVFPHKQVATRAGVGWLGKSTLLVTPAFGPRVRLGTLLLEEALPADRPITDSRCGNCDQCSVACPNDAIHNVAWRSGEGTEKLFSPAGCAKREAYVPILGRKHACGLCVLACPVGR